MTIQNIQSNPQDYLIFYDFVGLGMQPCFTVGAGTYTSELNFTVFYNELGEIPHFLLGRFSSLARGITCVTGANHSYKNVSSFPFDTNVVRNLFGDVEPVPNTRPNHYQVIVGHDVWIGMNATILGGVKIGNGAVVGAGSVVTRDVPPYAIVAGNPARIVKYRFDELTIKKFLAVKWWNWSLDKIKANLPLMTDVEGFLSQHWSPKLSSPPVINLVIESKNFGRQVSKFTTSSRTFDQFSHCG